MSDDYRWRQLIDKLSGIASTLGWIAFWLFCITLNTCKPEVVAK